MVNYCSRRREDLLWKALELYEKRNLLFSRYRDDRRKLRVLNSSVREGLLFQPGSRYPYMYVPLFSTRQGTAVRYMVRCARNVTT